MLFRAMGSRCVERDEIACKIFIGGLPREATESSLVKHFGKYGAIVDKIIMVDKFTGQPRGFGFVTFSDPSPVDIVMEYTHIIHGKTVEIKRTIPRRNSGYNNNDNDFINTKTKKIFVGGIPVTLTDDEFGDFFARFGRVTDYQIIKDRETNRSRGFGFVVFESENSVDFLLSNGNMVNLDGFQVEVKRAQPKKHSFQHKTRSSGNNNEYNNGFDGYGFGPVLKNSTRLAGRLGNYSTESYFGNDLLGYASGYRFYNGDYGNGFGSVLGGYRQMDGYGMGAGTSTGYGLTGTGGAVYGMRGTGYGARYNPYGR